MRQTAIVACTLALLFGASSVAAAQTDPNVKTTVTDIQYRIVLSQEIPGNCAVLSFSQWEAAKLKGWEAYQVAVKVGMPGATRTDTFSVSPPPKYDDELRYGGTTVSPPNGSHWVLIGDGSFYAGPPPHQCDPMLERVRAVVPDGKVTTSFRRTAACATKFATLTAAQKAAKQAKTKKARRKLAKAKKAFNRTCTR